MQKETWNASRKSPRSSTGGQGMSERRTKSVVDLNPVEAVGGGVIGVEDAHVGSGPVGGDQEGPNRWEIGGELDAVGPAQNAVPRDLAGAAGFCNLHIQKRNVAVDERRFRGVGSWTE